MLNQRAQYHRFLSVQFRSIIGCGSIYLFERSYTHDSQRVLAQNYNYHQPYGIYHHDDLLSECWCLILRGGNFREKMCGITNNIGYEI